MVYFHDVGFCKPEREIYLPICERLGLAPEQVAFVDDHPDSILGAKEVGIHTMAFTDHGTAIGALEAWLSADA